MSAMKLQKLCYYSQAWSLVFDGEKLFDDSIQAWANGPVVRSLYAQHRGQFTVDSTSFPAKSRLTDGETATIDAVLNSYGGLTATQLSNLTHNEEPWLEARRGVPAGARSEAEISPATMLEFYQRQHDAAVDAQR